MLPLPSAMIAILHEFAPVFNRRLWPWVQVLVVGAILAPGKRTVTTVLGVMGLSQEAQFQKYQRVLNRARWSSRRLSQILLRLLVEAFVPAGAPLLVELDETIERRKGAKLAAKGIYRDAVRSSQGHFVKASGLRWVSLMLLVRVRGAGRNWALPFLSVLAPSPGPRPLPGYPTPVRLPTLAQVEVPAQQLCIMTTLLQLPASSPAGLPEW